MDLWSFSLFHTKDKDLIQITTFYKEAIKCVFTRHDNPHYVVKTLVRVESKARWRFCDPRMASMASDEPFLTINTGSDFVYIDAPVVQILEVMKYTRNSRDFVICISEF